MDLSRRVLLQFFRQAHTSARNGPSDTLKRKIAGLEKMRKRRDPRNDRFFVDVPESLAYLDTATMPMILTAVGVAIFAKLLMMEDLKDWTLDVFLDALTRVEETAKHGSK